MNRKTESRIWWIGVILSVLLVSGDYAGREGWFSGDHIIHVSTSGSDNSDGLSPKRAKLTLNAALSALPSTGGVIQLGDGIFTCTGTLTLKSHVTIKGAGRGRTEIIPANGTDLITITTSLSFVHFSDVWLFETVQGGGDLIKFTGSGALSQSTFQRVLFKNSTTTKHLIYGAAIGNFVENRFLHCEFQGAPLAGSPAVPTTSVPLIHLIGNNNGLNVNVWDSCRVSQAGPYWLVINETSGTARADDNVIRNINHELPQGGSVKLLGCNNTLIENLVGYDQNAAGTNPFIYVGSDPTNGLGSQNTTIRNSGNRGGILGATGPESYDVYLEAGKAPRTTFESFDNGTSSAPNLFIGNNTQVELRGMLPSTTIVSASTTTFRRDNTGLTFGEDTTLARLSSGVMGVNGTALATASTTKVYRALLTQSGTSAPVATVLENTLGGTVVWTRDSTGVYTGTLASAFTANKTMLFCGSGQTSDGWSVSVLAGLLNPTTSTIRVFTNSADQNPLDDELANTSIEVLVYP
jgi:hypothetical protein